MLLVEDDEDDYLIMRGLLQAARRQYRLTWAATYNDALAQFERGGHDIAFVDYHLGGRTGLDLIAAIGHHRIPLVLLTGVENDEVDEAAARLGAVDYLPKSAVTVTLLERTIRYALARAQAHRETQESETRLRAVIEQAHDPIVILDHPGPTEHAPADQLAPGRVAVWNPAAAALFQIAADDAIGRDLHQLLNLPHGTGETVLTLRSGRRVVVEFSTSTWPGEHGYQTCHIFHDVTTQVVHREQLHRRATRDQLTGLVNRGTFLDEVERALHSPRDRAADSVALLYLDLDGFKQINDQHGHSAGDELLRQAARRLLDQLRGNDVAARLGGDEFAVLLRHTTSRSDLLSIAQRCLHALGTPYPHATTSHQITASIGIATAQPDDHAQDLIDRADQSMYAAKRAGKAQIHFKSP